MLLVLVGSSVVGASRAAWVRCGGSATLQTGGWLCRSRPWRAKSSPFTHDHTSKDNILLLQLLMWRNGCTTTARPRQDCSSAFLLALRFLFREGLRSSSRFCAQICQANHATCLTFVRGLQLLFLTTAPSQFQTPAAPPHPPPHSAAAPFPACARLLIATQSLRQI